MLTMARTVVLIAMVVTASAMLDPLDFLALQSMRKSMDDMPGSGFFKGWDFSKDPCSFPGVVCEDKDGTGTYRVVALNLGDPSAEAAGLQGRVDGAVGYLSELMEFTIVPGGVTGTIPQTLTACSKLELVGISRNKVTGSIPLGFGSLTKLQTLDLSFNHLSGSIPPSLASLPSLSNLILSHNHISGSIPALTSTNLIRLDLKHNNLTGPLPTILPHSLQYLSLSYNQLTGTVKALSLLANLKHVDLSFNRFKG